MPERLIIKDYSDRRTFTSRARLASHHGYAPAKRGDSPDELTDLGKVLLAAFEAVDGITVSWVQAHSVNVVIVHPLLWSWDEVEPGIVAAWAQVLGGQPEIIREGQ